MSTDVTQTRDTTGVVGNTAAIPAGTAGNASVKDTTPTGGGGGGDNNKPATQPDTEGVQGGPPLADHYLQTISQTLDTQTGGGSPRQDASPAYRAPSLAPAASVRDTTRTDLPVSNGTDRDLSASLLTGNKDTVNLTVPLQTTSTNQPTAPTAPTVAAGPRSVTVTITEVADPSGAAIRGYRVEGSTGGVDFAPRDPSGTTVVVIGNLTPSTSYKFRVAAYNDNGESAFSAFSAAVTPLNPDEAGPGHPSAITADNAVNPIYSPDGTVKAGTHTGTGAPTTYPLGQVQGAGAATGATTAGTIDVHWSAPAYGSPSTYTITPAGKPAVTVPFSQTAVTLTGLTAATAYNITIVATNASGSSKPVTVSATSHA